MDTMEDFMEFLRQCQPCTGLNTGNVMVFMIMVIAVCSRSWGPLFPKKPANGHDGHNPEGSPPPSPPANN